MHKKNLHQGDYDLQALITAAPELEAYIYKNDFGKVTVDFSNPKAVKLLNKGLLKRYYNISYWDFPDTNLCPPIPGRVDYIHLLNDLIVDTVRSKTIKILDIGTGATCIYPLLGHAVYGWSFVGTDIHKNSLQIAQKIVDNNHLSQHISLRLQQDPQQILTGVLSTSETLTASMCNPPFFSSAEEAQKQTQRKLKGLGTVQNKTERNFSGLAHELWYPGGEKAFLHNYLYQSSLLKTNCVWYTSLVSKSEHIKSMKTSLEKLGAQQIKILDSTLGNKKSRVVAWTFFSKKALQELKENEASAL
ncbi:23S rRNA (adenine(1618)-N(6))-methyltransferase RlmF [Psychroserpens sp. BH13MA-6]